MVVAIARGGIILKAQFIFDFNLANIAIWIGKCRITFAKVSWP